MSRFHPRTIRFPRPAGFVLLALALAALFLSCDDDPTKPGGGSSHTKLAWVEIDTFENGGRIAAVCGHETEDLYCGYLGLKRLSDGWVVYTEGAVVSYDGSGWSDPIFEIRDSWYDLDMCAVPGGDIYLADGKLRRFDGRSWKYEGIAANVVCGTSPSNIYAASNDDGAVRRYDGDTWQLLRELEVDGENWIKAIWAAEGPFLVVALVHSAWIWDGVVWSENSFSDFTYIENAWGTGPDNVYLVGSPYSPNGLMMHYDGTGWEGVNIPECGELNAVWGSGPNDIWAVGCDGTIIHYGGDTWTGIDKITFKHLWDVWGRGPGDVYAVGDDDKALHFDGASWESIRKEKPGSDVLYIWAESADRFAVLNWLDRGTVYLYDEGEWTEEYIGVDVFSMRTLAGRSLDDLYVLADQHMYHFDGENWSYSADLDAYWPGKMWFTDSGAGFAIGGYSIFQFNGSIWSEVVRESEWSMTSIWGASENTVYVVHREGIIYHYNGSSWQTVPPPDGAGFSSVWGVSGTEVYFQGVGVMYRYDGASWQSIPAPDNYYLANLVLTAGDNMFLHGGCWFGHFNGMKWNVECNQQEPPLMIIESRDGSILRMTQRGIYAQAKADR